MFDQELLFGLSSVELPACLSKEKKIHYTDVIMGAMASQIVSLTIVY